jgi:uncharacterized protein (DUF1697 family)
MAHERRYIAFLRGINVGGNKLIRMAALADAFRAAGFRNARTYIASGNVIFDSRGTKVEVLEKKAEKKLRDVFGHEITVVILSVTELQKIIERQPFKRMRSNADVMLLVTFLKHTRGSVKLPLESKTEKLKVLEVENRAAFTIARRKKTGWFGFPNNFIERELGVPATTRQWRTVEKVLAASANL